MANFAQKKLNLGKRVLPPPCELQDGWTAPPLVQPCMLASSPYPRQNACAFVLNRFEFIFSYDLNND